MNLFNYKIWLLLFGLATVGLSFWTLDFLSIFYINANKNNVEIISPTTEFKKESPPKDKSFPNDDGSLWDAFKTNNKDLISESEKINNEKQQDSSEVKNYEELAENQKPLINNNFEKKLDQSKHANLEDNKKKENINLDGIQKKEIDKNKSNLEDNEILDASDDNIKPENEKKAEFKKDNRDSSQFFLQIASVSSEGLVVKEWDRLNKKYANQLNNFKYKIQKAILKDKGTFYRIFLGEFASKSDANKFCKEIILLKNCIIKKIE